MMHVWKCMWSKSHACVRNACVMNSGARVMRQGCMHHAAGMRASCVRDAFIMRHGCVHHAAGMRASCVNGASEISLPLSSEDLFTPICYSILFERVTYTTRHLHDTSPWTNVLLHKHTFLGRWDVVGDGLTSSFITLMCVWHTYTYVADYLRSWET